MWDVFFPLGTFKRRKEKAYAEGGTRFASIVRKAKPQNEVAEDASEQMLREQTCVAEAEVSRGWTGCREPALFLQRRLPGWILDSGHLISSREGPTKLLH